MLIDGGLNPPLNLFRQALALDELRARTGFSRDLLDAAEGLTSLARGGKLELNDEGRHRAAFLASIVQATAQSDVDQIPMK
jgi:hypothetical protein